MTEAPSAPDRVLRWPEVKPLVGVSRVTWWRLTRAGKAPHAIQISPNTVGWFARDIAKFQAERLSALEVAA